MQSHTAEDPSAGAELSSAPATDAPSNGQQPRDTSGCSGSLDLPIDIISNQWEVSSKILSAVSMAASSVSADGAAVAAFTPALKQKHSGWDGLPAYAADGFQRVNLSAVDGLRWPSQICRTDERWRPAHCSQTVAFRSRL